MSQDLALRFPIDRDADGEFVVPVRFSEDYLRALVDDGLKMETGTRIQLLLNDGVFSLLFTPVLPLLICKECGFVGDTSEHATYTDESGAVRNAWMEDAYLTRCMNPECSRFETIFMIPRQTVLKNARKHERAKGEF